MRNDGQTQNLETDSPRLARTLALGGLGLLMAVTALAVGSVSLWLVVPYLGLMAWLLAGSVDAPDESTSCRSDTRSSEATASGTSSGERSPLSPDPGDGGTVEATLEPASVPTSTEEPSTRRRRGRGRGRSKAAKAAPPPDPVSVSWVQVGPGQFVRVEEPSSSSDEDSENSNRTVTTTAGEVGVTANEGSSSNPVTVAEAEPSSEGNADQPSDAVPPTLDEPEVSPVESEDVAFDPGLTPQESDPEPAPTESPANLGAPVPDVEAPAGIDPVEVESSETPASEPAVDEEPTEPEPVAYVNQVESPEAPAFEPAVDEESALVAETPLVEAPAPDVPEADRGVLGSTEPEPAPELETPGEQSEASDLESVENPVEETLADAEVGEGDLPQAGAFEASGHELEGDPSPADSEPAPAPEFDGESRTSSEPNGSLSPTIARAPNWPAWLPRSRALMTRINVRVPVPEVSRPSRVRQAPRQANGPRRCRSWHGKLRFEPRAPPRSVLLRPPGVRRAVRSQTPHRDEIPSASQAA